MKKLFKYLIILVTLLTIGCSQVVMKTDPSIEIRAVLKEQKLTNEEKLFIIEAILDKNELKTLNNTR